MSKLFIIILVFSIPLFSCASNKIQQPVNNIDIISDEEYEVCSFIINYAEIEKKCRWEYRQSIFTIRELTQNHFGLSGEEEFKVGSPSIEKGLIEAITNLKMDISLIDDFKKKDERQYKLENRFSLHRDITLIPERELEKSSGFIEMSRVGFNSSYTQAILYYGRQVWLEGNGVFFFLAKENNKWIVKHGLTVWIS